MDCSSCGHDIEDHHPHYDYGQRDHCHGGTDCRCDGFAIRRSAEQ